MAAVPPLPRPTFTGIRKRGGTPNAAAAAAAFLPESIFELCEQESEPSEGLFSCRIGSENNLEGAFRKSSSDLEEALFSGGIIGWQIE